MSKLRLAFSLLILSLLLPNVAHGQMNIAPSPADPGTGLLLHVSWDRDRRAEVATGIDVPYIVKHSDMDGSAESGTLTQGRFGQAQTGKKTFGWYDALGNFLPQRGTIAFHVKQKDKPYGFEPFNLHTVDQTYWNRYIRLKYRPEGLSLWIANETYKPTVLFSNAGGTLRPNDWTHLAIVWDESMGMKLFAQGKEVASNWGKASWLSLGIDPDYFWLVNDDNVSYDELYVFDRPLSPEQIATLATKNIAPSRNEMEPVLFDEVHRTNRLKELSWLEPDPAMPQATLGLEGPGVNAIRQVAPVTARAVMKDSNSVFDGKLGSGWPPIYNYGFNHGNGLHVQISEQYDYATIEGHFAGRIYAQRVLAEQPKIAPMARIDSRQFMYRWRLPSPREAGWMSLFKSVVEEDQGTTDKEQLITSRVCDMGFFKLGEQRLAGATPVRYHLGAATIDNGTRMLGVEMTGRFAPGDRATLSTSTTPPTAAGGQTIAALRYHHVLIPPVNQRVALRGLRLGLLLGGIKADETIRIEMRDAMFPARRLLALDYALVAGADASKPQWLDLTLDINDRIIPAGKPIWLSICLKHDVQLLWDGVKHNSFVELLTGKIEESLPEFVESELAFARPRFRELSESRVWDVLKEPENKLTTYHRVARELFWPLSYLRELGVTDPRLTAMWLWTHKDYTDISPVAPKAVPGVSDAPRWALLQRELMRGCRDVLYWWIDHRQTPNGELGDDWNDDSDLMQNTAKQILFADPGDRITTALRKVTQGVYDDGRIKKGINTNLTDALHAYEEGVNLPPTLALVDWGDPVNIERLMEASLTIEEFLTAKDARGRRRFRSSDFGADGVLDKGDSAVDQPDNGLFCHPALTLGFYNHQPRAVRFLRDWLDGWLDYFAQAKASGETRFPCVTHFDGRVMSWNTRVLGFGFVDAWVGTHAITGDAKYADTSRFWTGPYPAKFGTAMSGLEWVDYAAQRDKLAAVAKRADLAHVTTDLFGRKARERYLAFEVAGDEEAAMESLEASLRNLRLMFDGYTWAEPIADRVWLPDHAAVVMALGEMPHERNDIWPRHYVSYHGFSDHAAWVREKSNTRLVIWLYNFSSEMEKGNVRVWRTPLGQYEVRFGQAEPDGKLSPGITPKIMTLHRASDIPIAMAPRTKYVMDIRWIGSPKEDFWGRADPAVSAATTRRAGPSTLHVRIHNLGNSTVKDAKLRVFDGTQLLTEKTVGMIEAPLDLHPRSVNVVVENVPVGRPLRVVVVPNSDDADLNPHNNEAIIP